MTHISVDLRRLHELCNALKADNELGLTPGLGDVDSRIQHGVRFARISPSGEAEPARRALLAALNRYRENSHQHMETARLIVTVLDQVLALYLSTDARAEVDIRKLLARIEDDLKATDTSTLHTNGLQP